MSRLFDTHVEEWKEQIDECIREIISELDYSPEFKDVLSYALFPGGKRLRPIIMLEWHSMFAPPDEYALRYACGIEILHSYSLIHDDLPCMDNDDYRRGKLTVHKMYGESKALLAGDALMDLAYAILYAPTPRGGASPFCIFKDLCGNHGLIEGQYRDLFVPVNGTDDRLCMYDLKTGALMKLAALSGFALGKNMDYAYLSDVYAAVHDDKRGYARYRDEINGLYAAVGFGEAFGRAFQLYDDISEYINGEKTSETSVLVKTDFESSKHLLNINLNNALDALRLLNTETAFFKELVDSIVII